MNKTILLGLNNKFSLKTNLWGHLILGILFVVQGVYHIESNIVFPLGRMMGIILVPAGIAYSIYGFLSFNKFSKYAPGFSISEDELSFKKSLLKPAQKIPWSHIKKIEMAPYLLIVSTEESETVMHYSSNPEISKEIKSTVREMAESKGIEVLGG